LCAGITRGSFIEVIRRVRVNDRKTTLREFIMEKFKS
jgi:hypothetical protein